MASIIIIAAIAGAIVFAAGRIILGWVLPAPKMAGVDRFFRAAGKLYLQLMVVALALLIVVLVISATRR